MVLQNSSKHDFLNFLPCQYTIAHHLCLAFYKRRAIGSYEQVFFQCVHERLSSQQTFIISNAFDDVA